MRFPLDFIPAESWTVEPRKFGAWREGGRLHGACDLYAPVGTPVYAIQDGLIGTVCGYPVTWPHPYVFYKGSYALEVTSHDGSGIWRYCELMFLPAMRVGHGVKEGDLLGHIADLGNDSAGRKMPSMLHLELYSKTAQGALSISGFNKYGRRADLVDPTELLSALAGRVVTRIKDSVAHT